MIPINYGSKFGAILDGAIKRVIVWMKVRLLDQILSCFLLQKEGALRKYLPIRIARYIRLLIIIDERTCFAEHVYILLLQYSTTNFAPQT